ncbi:thiamine monophosphate synthase [Clostridium tetani]|uniref:Thiamine phosphate synthase n=2 Tax=Clostridium tetani TaxID=1513 RepID=A0ABY0EQ56_CLOTA|nr:thiamine monophosphate synthase [Clostridium tetani]RXI39542.1 thiamine phosphate synthase [Clostridium tetani]RXI53843.1 thiamine phosphate synthase [Clostridium tetani]RXI73454.1 thiamine phosphate synthase [Clostridium tetani]
MAKRFDIMIFVVTNRKICGKENFIKTIEECAKYKPFSIILREKDLDYKNLYKLAVDIKKVTDKYNIPFIINGNLKISKELNTWGYHCGISAFRKINVKVDRKLGVSVHSLDEAVEAEKLGADYILAGHIYETECKEGLKGRGQNFIKSISQKVSIPIIAIGGITEENTANVIKSGAKGIAIMSSAMKNPSTILTLKKEFSTTLI